MSEGERPGVAIVGGGPAGSAAAITLGRAGQRPLLIERTAEPGDALCGGFLSWATVARLAELGVEPVALGARPVTELWTFHGERSAGARLPAPAAGLSRRMLDAALLNAAEAAGAEVRRGITVRSFEDGVLRLADGGAIRPERLILATGKHELRGCARPRAEGDAAVGLRWRLRASARLDQLLEGRIELHLFHGGYAGVVRHEDGMANLCLAVRRSRLTESGGRPDALLSALVSECPALGERLLRAGGIEPVQTIANIPYGWRANAADAGFYRVGDQAAVIPSLAGEGIAIALASGAAAARAVLDGTGPPAFHKQVHKRLGLPFAIAGGLLRMSESGAGASAIVAAVRLAPPLARWASGLTRAKGL